MEFREQLEKRGSAPGLNGADYKCVVWRDDEPAIERVYNGQRELIVGYNGSTFNDRYQAIMWADMDQKLELVSMNVPTYERRPIRDRQIL